MPARICPPSFNRFSGGQNYGTHNDAALLCFPEATAPRWVRTDLAATLFLAAPEDYDGGELVIEDTFGPVRVKLPAGDMVVYPASSQHRVEPVTRGARVGSFIWLQSLVRDDNHRKLLHDLDTEYHAPQPGDARQQGCRPAAGPLSQPAAHVVRYVTLASPERLWSQAAALQRAGRIADAATLYRQFIALRPDVVEARVNLANLLAATRRTCGRGSRLH